MNERIKISFYWLLVAIAVVIIPYKAMFFFGVELGDNMEKEPKFLIWIMGVILMVVCGAVACLAAYGFYRWMHWLLNGNNEKKTGGGDSVY